MNSKKFFVAGFIVAVAYLPSFADTYYVSSIGSDTAGDGSNSHPWRTTTKAFSRGGGHTYILKDGVYDYPGGTIEDPPGGTPGNPTIIKAENDGQAILDGQGRQPGIRIVQKQYIIIEGFRVQNCGENPAVEVISPDGTPISNQSNNIIIRRTGAKGSAQSSDNAVWTVARARDSLIEDVWASGFGRYSMLVYGSTNVTVRRAVLRWDGWGRGAEKPGDPKFNLGVYDTHDSLFENILLLDAADDPFGGDKGGLFVPGNSNGDTAPYTDSDNNRFFGVIALNNIGVGVSVEGHSGGTNDDNRFVDLVSWGNTGEGIAVARKANNTTFNHCTIGKNRRGSYFGDSGNNVSGTVLTNSPVYLNAENGVNGSVSTSYNNVHANGDDYVGGASPGPNSFSQDPLLLHITQIEVNSPGKGTAYDGGDRGANVIKKYVDGRLTGDALWPWPNEGRIRSDMCEGETRGFCGASWNSLTDYLWRQLGNAAPTSPDPPTDVTLTNPTTSSLTLSWVPPAGEVAAAGYRLDVSTDPSFASFVPGYNNKDLGNVSQFVITGLVSQTAHYARLQAYDAAQNRSRNSEVATATTLAAPDNTPPSVPTNLSLNDPTPFSLTLSWMASSDDTAVAGYELDMALDPSFSKFAEGYNGKDLGNVIQTTIGNLQPQTTIFVRLRAYDAVGHRSLNSAVASGTPSDSNPSCKTAIYPSSQWQNEAFTPQGGAFTVEVDVTPSAPNVDAAVAVSSGPKTDWGGLAATVLFYTDGRIKAINGGAYTGSTISYTGNKTYRARMVIDVVSYTYSAYVTPPGGAEQAIGINLSFRSGQEAVTGLNNWTVVADAGSLITCNFAVTAPQQLALQNGLNGYAGVTDTWINYYDPNLNLNGETKLSVYGSEDIKTLIRFDLSSIPQGAVIRSATLSLYNYSHAGAAEGGMLSVYRAIKPWAESQATWNIYSTGNPWSIASMRAGADYSTSPEVSITIDTAINVWRNFGVTAIVQQWVNGVTANNGFVVRSPTRGVKPHFYSSAYPSHPALRPKLTIFY